MEDLGSVSDPDILLSFLAMELSFLLVGVSSNDYQLKQKDLQRYLSY